MERAVAEICLLGRPSVRFSDGSSVTLGSNQSTQVLALLLLHRNEALSRKFVFERIWEEPEADEARRNSLLRPVLTTLRNVLRDLGVEGLELPREDDPLKLSVPSDAAVDFVRVEAEFEFAGATDDDDTRWDLARRVIDSLDEKLLKGCRNVTPFLNDQRGRLEDIRYRAQIRAIELARRSTDDSRRKQAKQDAEAAIKRWGGLEEPRIGLIRLHLRDDALDQAEIAIDAFREQLGSGSDQIDELREELQRRRWRHDNGPLPLMVPVAAEEEEADFVGHDRELEILESGLDRVIRAGFFAAALGGEKGVGKSRLSRELARIAHGRGCAVLSASALQPVSRQDHPCRPFIEAVSVWINRFGVADMSGVKPTDLAEIGQHAPELFDHLPGQQIEQGRVPERLRAALKRVLAGIGGLAPTVVLLDDVQAVDDESVALLRDLRAVAPGGLMILATGPRGYLADVLRPIPVPLLPPAEARELAAAVHDLAGADDRPGLDFSAGGNPFLIVNRTALDRIEADFVLPQIASAGPAGLEILRLAALLGSPFELSALRAAAGEDDIETVLVVAAERKLIRRGQEAGTFEFSHSLIREALLDGIDAFARSHLAQRLVEALDPGRKSSAAARLRLLKEVAITQPDVRTKAAATALEAGEHASGLPNYEAARTHCEEGLDLVGTEEVGLRGHLLVELGNCLWGLGEFGLAQQRFVEAQALAGLPPIVRAEAALGFGGRLGFAGARTDRTYIRMLRNALAELPEGYEDRRLRLHAALVGALTFGASNSKEKEERERLCARVLAEAEEAEPTLAAEVLSDVCWAVWEPDRPEGRRELAEKFVDRAEQSPDIRLRLEARIFRLASALEDGEMGSVERDLIKCEELAEFSEQPHFRALIALLDGMKALLDDTPEKAAEHAQEALELGGKAQNPAVFELYGAQILMIRLFEGRVDKIRAASEAITEAFPRLPGLRAGLGVIYAELGRTDDAKRQLATIAENHFEGVPRDVFWLVTIEHASRLAVRLGNQQLCEELYGLLEPYSGRIAVAGGAVAVYGAVDRALGLMAGARGDREREIEHLRNAVAINDRIGAHTINAFVMRELADALRHGRAAEAEIERLRETAKRVTATRNLAPGPREQALAFAKPEAPPGVLGGVRRRGAHGFSHFIRRRIEGRSDESIEQGQFPTRVIRWMMPTAFVPEAACGWTGAIEVEFNPPIGYQTKSPFWTFVIGERQAQIFPEPARDATVRLGMSPATFFKLIAGSLNPVEAWLDSRAFVEGDPTVAARLIEMFSGPTPTLGLGEEA